MAKDLYKLGWTEAETEATTGTLSYLVLGLRGPIDRSWADILRRDYGIRLREVGGCLIDMDLVERARGHNEYIRRLVSERYGSDVISAAHALAEQEVAVEVVDVGEEIKSLWTPREARADAQGWVDCPHCGRRFSTHSKRHWDGQHHKSCLGKVTLVWGQAAGSGPKGERSQ